MTFQIAALDPAPFAPLFALTDAELAAHNARRVVADKSPGFPCRVSLVDAAPGETLILVNHEHLGGDTPYAQRHAIYVRDAAAKAEPAPGEIPPALQGRPISLRAYDAASMLIDTNLARGDALPAAIDALFARPDTAFVHLHNAMHGCFVAAVTRA